MPLVSVLPAGAGSGCGGQLGSVDGGIRRQLAGAALLDGFRLAEVQAAGAGSRPGGDALASLPEFGRQGNAVACAVTVDGYFAGRGGSAEAETRSCLRISGGRPGP